MSRARLIFLTALTLLAFAGNSLLCRGALRFSSIDAGSFTSIRLISGAAMLWILLAMRSGRIVVAGSWWSALLLFVYAADFSFAYISLSSATGALLLFGAVQATMIGRSLSLGERPSRLQWLGIVLAGAGLVGLLLPGLSAPPWHGALLMLMAGVAWGLYSLRGQGSGDPVAVTAGNFLRTVPMAIALGFFSIDSASVEWDGVGYAVASGALASALGYVVWYTVLPALKATSAATLQLSVPVITAVGGIVLLGEPLSLRFVLASATILGGIALVIRNKRV